MKFLQSLTVFLAASSLAISAHAEPDATTNQAPPDTSPTATTTGLRADVEVDPTAFVLDGFSLHSGLGAGHWRVDLGVFGLTVPEAFHGQDGFDVSFDGYGVKLQYFLFEPQTGGFVGVDAAVVRARVALDGTELAKTDRQYAAGVNFGWRFDLPAEFYVTPWLGLGYAFGAEDIVLDDQRFEPQPFNVFPAIHLGYHLR